MLTRSLIVSNMLFCVIEPVVDTILRDEVRDCLKEVVQAYKDQERSLSILQVAKLYVVLKTKPYKMINRC